MAGRTRHRGTLLPGPGTARLHRIQSLEEILLDRSVKTGWPYHSLLEGHFKAHGPVSSK